MSHKINGSLLVLGQVLNLKPELLATDPTGGALGTEPRIWANSTDGMLKFFNGTTTVALGDTDGITSGELATALAPYAQTADVTSAIATAVSGLATEQDVTDAVANLVSTTSMTNAIENALAGLDFQSDVVGLESDFVDQAGRYVYVDGTTFATGVAAAAGDIVSVDAAGVIVSVDYDVSAQGAGALVWNTTGVEWLRWDGATWATFGGLTGVSAGNGVQKVGDEISIKLDGASLTVGANGLKVGDLSATYATVTALTTAIANFQTAAQVSSAIAAATADFVTESDLTAVTGVLNDLQSQVGASFFPFSSGATSATTHTITHNLNYQWPIVQLVDPDTNETITADKIEFTSANELVVTFASAAKLRASISWINTTA